MDYKLTEDQSTEFYNNMYIIHKHTQDISTCAISIVEKWFELYEKNQKWYNISRSYESFLKSIGTLDGLEVKESSLGFDVITIRNNSGWCTGLKTKKIAEMTGLYEEQIQQESEAVWNAVKFIYKYNSFLYKNRDFMEDIKMYCIVPYTIDEIRLNHMKRCKELIQELGLED